MRTLSVVVPVYGTQALAARLLSHLGILAETARRSGFELIEAILVDDGSPTPLWQGAIPVNVQQESPVPIRLLRHAQNRGKGAAVRTGVLAAQGAWVLMSDADESAQLSEFACLAREAEDAWMVCGSRYICGHTGVPLHRRVLSRIFRFCVSGLGVGKIRDTQCGFKLFRMDVMRVHFEALCTPGFAFDVELLRRVYRAGGIVKECPVNWQGNKRSTLRVFRDAPRIFWELLCLIGQS